MKKVFFLILMAIFVINGFCQNASINTARTLVKNHYYLYDNLLIKKPFDNIVIDSEYIGKSNTDTLF